MTTTIQLSKETKKMLDRLKLYARETYNDVIERLIEDELRLSTAARKGMEEARKHVESGKFIPHHEVSKRYAS